MCAGLSPDISGLSPVFPRSFPYHLSSRYGEHSSPPSDPCRLRVVPRRVWLTKVKSELKADGSAPRGVWLVRRAGSDDVVAVVFATDIAELSDTIRVLTPRGGYRYTET